MTDPTHLEPWTEPAWRQQVRRRLLAWFSQHARDLPWRRDPTPYRVWISEVMLQQTQVATVVPYYQRFLRQFPSVVELANAQESRLLSLWEGLGYYRRARSMHAAAKLIVQRHNGQFPEDFDQVLALPGIGRYTAGAILSIALDQRRPILEGNTQRVWARLVSLRQPVTEKATIDLLWQISESLLPRKRTGCFNQAAMELGALICTPKNPKCLLCPLRKLCAAHRDGLEGEIPGRVSRVRYEDRTEFALLVGKGHRFLIRPLPEGGRWAGLWDFPRTTRHSLPDVESACRQLAEEIGVAVKPGGHVTTIRHAVTRFRISLQVYDAALPDDQWRPTRPWAFMTLDEMAELPLSVTGRKIVNLLARRAMDQSPTVGPKRSGR